MLLHAKIRKPRMRGIVPSVSLQPHTQTRNARAGQDLLDRLLCRWASDDVFDDVKFWSKA